MSPPPSTSLSGHSRKTSFQFISRIKSSAMLQILPSIFSALQPRADHLSQETRVQVQIHRLLSLLGAGFVVGFGPLYALSNPGAVDPLWARLAVSGLFACLFIASYASSRIRRAYVPCMQAVLYVTMGWFAVLATLNRFSVDYAVGLLLVYAILAAVVGYSARSIGPALWFLVYGFLLVVGGVLISPEPEATPTVLLACVGTFAIVEAVLIRGWLQIRDTIREQESRLRGLANSLPGAVFQFYAREDESMGHYFVSEHAEEVLGISADPDGFYERCMEHIPKEAREAMERSIETAIAEEKSWQFETPFDRPDGTRIWTLGTSVPERREGEVVFNGVILDITDRKRAEQALEEERDRLETLFEALPTPVVHCTDADRGAQVVDANAAFEDTFGVSIGEVRGREIDEILVPAEKEDEARALDRRALEEGSLQTEVRRTTADGPRDFQLQVAGRHPEGESPEIFAVYTDITERKRRERRLSAIFNQTYQFTGLMEPDGTVIEANDTALQFGGIEEEDVLGDPLWESPWAQAGPETKRTIREAIREARNGEFVRDEIEIQGAEENRIIDFSVRPVTDGDDVTLLIPEGRDITERIEKERRLQEQEAQLRGLANSIPGVVYQFRVDAEGTYGFGFVGERAEEVLGISAEEDGFFERFVERVPESHRGLFLESIETAVEEEAFWREEVPFDRPYGERIWVLATSTPERRGEELVFNGVILNVTERSLLQRHVGAHTLEMIRGSEELDRDLAEQGQMQDLAVLFTDLRGSTDQIERTAPREFIRQLNRTFSTQAKIATHFDGSIDKFVGDAMIAIFAGDAPLERALRCSIEIQRAFRTDPLSSSFWKGLGIGVNYGPMLVGNVGTEERLDYSVIGAEVNLCARLCEAAEPGQILVRRDLMEHHGLDDVAQIESVGTQTFEGFDRPFEIAEVHHDHDG